jgi:hypothetical protein
MSEFCLGKARVLSCAVTCCRGGACRVAWCGMVWCGMGVDSMIGDRMKCACRSGGKMWGDMYRDTVGIHLIMS